MLSKMVQGLGVNAQRMERNSCMVTKQGHLILWTVLISHFLNPLPNIWLLLFYGHDLSTNARILLVLTECDILRIGEDFVNTQSIIKVILQNDCKSKQFRICVADSEQLVDGPKGNHIDYISHCRIKKQPFFKV